jgi:hypothetical protein
MKPIFFSTALWLTELHAVLKLVNTSSCKFIAQKQLSENKLNQSLCHAMAWVNSYSWVLYSSLQNLLQHYSFSSLMYFEEKIKGHETQNNCKVK